jgi:hypothetical protein
MAEQVYIPPTPGEAVDNEDEPVSDEVVVLLEANSNRTSALIFNTGDGDMRVTTDGSDPTPTRGKPVGKGSCLSMSGPRCSAAAVKAIRSGDVDTTANASEVN